MAVNSLFKHRALIKHIRTCEGGTRPYRHLWARVRGTPEETTFWALMSWRALAFELRALLDHQNRLLYEAARSRT